MTDRCDRAQRLRSIASILARRMPVVLDAALALLETVPLALDAARAERYQIQRQIGAGGHAEVLMAVVRGADGFHRPVAIKRVRADLVEQGRFAAMLIEEAHLVAQLSHPNVISVLDFDRDSEGRPYLVMEYIDGVDLAALFETGPLPHPVVIFIVRELLDALRYLHEPRDRGRGVRGLLHRDVTPRNVLLSREGEIKLADFGVATTFEGAMTVTTDALAGTPGYMSPEQARRSQLDGRSDLYAVGIVLWELLAHERLRVGWPGDINATAAFHAIPPPSKHRRVPVDLEAIAMRLLALERDDRYRTTEIVASDLMRCGDVPRDGRAELARVLKERFPHSRQQWRLLRPSELSPITVARPCAPADAPPWPSEPDGQRSDRPSARIEGDAQQSGLERSP